MPDITTPDHSTEPALNPSGTATGPGESADSGSPRPGLRDVTNVRQASALGGAAAGALRRGSLLVVWAALFVVFALLEPNLFLTQGTLQTIFGSQQALVFIALGTLCAFVVGEFDFSVASVAGLAATLVPVLVTDQQLNVWLACLIALCSAVAVGALNALIVVRIGIDPIITTLGMATLVSGISSRIANSGTVSMVSPELTKIASTYVLGLPINFFYGVALVTVFTYVLTSTPLGRHMRFVGSNRSVARLAMVRVNRIRAGAYLMSSLLCGIGGVLLVGTVGGFDPSSSPSYLLPVLSATFLGTAVIVPGRFNPVGTFIAIYFLATGIVGLQLLGFAGWISDVFYGAALIIAIILSTLFRANRGTS
jgi:ribose transport system permease protein